MAIPETLQADVANRLIALGFSELNAANIEYQIRAAQRYIQNFCNIEEIPEALYYVWVDIAAGYYLDDGMVLNALTGIDLAEIPEKSIKEGDTQITYAIGDGSLTPEQRLINLINRLTKGCKTELIAHRRIKW